LWGYVLDLDRLVRLHQLFFTAVWLLLGAASVRPDLSASELAALLVVMLCFHVYTYVLNDVIDLPIDRTQPQRRDDPLVRGSIRPSTALLIALIQPVLTVPVTMWLGGGLEAHVTLAFGFAMMGAYNLWGKRCPFPPLTDVIQGFAWGSLAIYAAYALGARPNTLTWLVAGYVTVFALFFNGIHGSLRDLGNDFVRGARTTAIFFGARPGSGVGDAYVPRAVVVLASLVLAALIGLVGLVMARNDFGYSPREWAATTAAVAGLSLYAAILHPRVVYPRGPAWDVAWRLQLYVVAISLPVAFAAHSIGVALVLLSLNVLALSLFGCSAAVARWAWLTLQTAVAPGKRGAPTEIATRPQ
jgi:4-hydroxybenzoate polyprenyltransferase